MCFFIAIRVKGTTENDNNPHEMKRPDKLKCIWLIGKKMVYYYEPFNVLLFEFQISIIPVEEI